MTAALHNGLSERLLAETQHEPERDQELHIADPTSPPSLTSEESILVEQEHARVRKLLYTSHFLSTWNSRFFEFGAFLFLARIYPQTLLPASVYALARAASAAILSLWLGFLIDHSNRLHIVRLSIVGQRIAVTLSCLALFLMLRYDALRTDKLLSTSFLAFLSLLACVEKLSWVMNTISIERDWVVVIACGHEKRLRVLNSQMRRIDLFCKLIGPLAIALVDSTSSEAAIIVTGCISVASVLIEYRTIAKVYEQVPTLHAPKSVVEDARRKRGSLNHVLETFSSIRVYVRHSAFLPSISLALLYLTVLSFAGQMITYLITLGLRPDVIGALRGVSALFELSATWLAPKIMERIGPVRAGIWFLNWEMCCVAVACACLWIDVLPKFSAIGTVSAVILSRVGLWGFDLSAQTIVQQEVGSESRGTFSSQEFALQNAFEMLAFASTIFFPQPSQFKYPAAISAAAVGLAGILYAVFVRARRGHLVHLSTCIDRNGRRKDHHHWWMRIPELGGRVDEDMSLGMLQSALRPSNEQ